MNIILGNISIIVLLLLAMFFPSFSQAQLPASDSMPHFRIGLELGGGYGFKLSSTNTLPGNYSSGGFNTNIRLKWGSHNSFGAGLETGWLPISSLSSSNTSTEFGTTNIEASLNAVPLLFVLALQRFNVQIHGGVGYYNVRAKATVFESTIESSEWDFGYILAIGYVYPISPAYKLGAEIKWNNISEVQISMLSTQVRLLINLWQW